MGKANLSGRVTAALFTIAALGVSTVLSGCGATGATGAGSRAKVTASRAQGSISEGVYQSPDKVIRVNVPGPMVNGMGAYHQFQRTPAGIRNVVIAPNPAIRPSFSLTVVPAELPRAVMARRGIPNADRNQLREFAFNAEASILARTLGKPPTVVHRTVSETRFGPTEYYVMTADEVPQPGCRRLSGDPCIQDAVVAVHIFGTEDWTAILTLRQYLRDVTPQVVESYSQEQVAGPKAMIESLEVTPPLQ